MAKVTGPLFSMSASGSFGMIIFDRRGVTRVRVGRRDAKTTAQGNFWQAMIVAQCCAKVCGPNTRQLLRGIAPEPSRWSAYLAKAIIGPHRSNYEAYLQHYATEVADPTAWETAALSLRACFLNHVLWQNAIVHVILSDSASGERRIPNTAVYQPLSQGFFGLWPQNDI